MFCSEVYAGNISICLHFFSNMESLLKYVISVVYYHLKNLRPVCLFKFVDSSVQV